MRVGERGLGLVRVGLRLRGKVRRAVVRMRVEPGVGGSSSSLSALPAESRAASVPVDARAVVCSRGGGLNALMSIAVSEVRRTLLTST